MQGLPPSTILDSSLPRELQEWVGLLYSPVVSLSWLCYVMSNMWIFQLLGSLVHRVHALARRLERIFSYAPEHGCGRAHHEQARSLLRA